MLSKMQLFSLASAFLASEAAALVVNAHRVNHAHYHDKRDIAYQHTEVVVQTVWETVTVWDDDLPTSSVSIFKNVAPTTTSSNSTLLSSSFGSSSTLTTVTTPVASPPPPPEPTPAPTLASPPAEEPVKVQAIAPEQKAPQVAPQPQIPAPQVPSPQPTPSQSQAAPAPAKSSSAPVVDNSNSGSGYSQPSGSKRGLAYNLASLTSPFMGSGSKASWAYNWGQTPDGLDTTKIDYVPMLWGPQQMHTSTWKQNADSAIAAGAKSLLSFNECDNKGQCNTDPASAAQAHIQLMNPYGSKAAISSPAITNSNVPGEGIDWLKSWVKACNGQCKFDFCAAHWYSPADPQNLLSHLDAVHDACEGKPVWLTEFAPIDGDADTFLTAVMKELDNNPKYSYVQRYSFFFVTLQPHFTSARMMNTATSLSSLGQAFAYS
ncbi:hypothetical protein MGG_08577 [Pyricularia oryzae 70-15]|uniref:Asl1-like glycosyl hydrolase catalytic domain-containing protein n=4 Tax=Pyricularia oryzae TaxID=318829 RepID=G4N658_PYRO7|nr:uncharacterized protein MGG_08577 [Pyricularia oryzae 70-15]ELQ40738.1 hypothetical protein OOU_Y34scaffold00370g32 [Pyricularia oryzae Y34]KAI7917415.1 hypothetical protein M9X92_007415 [Pyricularia oryzae]EHA49782.1 hypothetical protein MGG_08577 [Pyricularia oryzae 70-15]KAI7923787.1 hypothetical protein M0657_004949 [Pyricularia oryzae]QBZ60320.1 hypothetical protein PoMZ_07260 [Pyricularia oryzae]